MSVSEGEDPRAAPCVDDAEKETVGEDDESYKIPPASTPDSLVTDTETPQTPDETVLKGDFEPENIKSEPELTLALIKPDGIKHVLEIEKKMREDGYSVVQKRKLQLTPEQASNFYYEHYGKPYFPMLVTTVCEDPIQVYVLRRKEAVNMWRIACGPANVEEAQKIWPESLRAKYGTPGEDFKNVCHASETAEKALEEIRFFFPNMVIDANILNETQVEDYLQEYVNPTLLEGLAQVCKHKPLDPVVWLADWLLMNNPYKPKMAENVTLTPT